MKSQSIVYNLQMELQTGDSNIQIAEISSMDPFRLCLALGPVAVYLIVLGIINLARRPFVVSGTRDTAALGLALAGMVLAGPFDLFYPNAAAVQFGSYVWLFLAALYLLSLILVLLSQRPRVVIYNIAIDELRPILADVAVRLDGEARWAGDSLSLPNLGVQLHIECSTAMRNASLVSSGAGQSHAGWRKLESELAASFRQFAVRRNGRVALLPIAGLAIIGLLVNEIVCDPQLVAAAMIEMFTH